MGRHDFGNNLICNYHSVFIKNKHSRVKGNGAKVLETFYSGSYR